MYLIEVDRSMNRLHVILLQTIDEKQAASFFRTLGRRIKELEEGFEVLSDLSRLEHIERSATFYIRRAMDLCNERGVGKIIRIVPYPRNNCGFNVMSNFHYDHNVPIVNCSSIEEAVRRIV